MASLGEQLKAARTAMDKSLAEISNDTNISKQYLAALEEDKYDVFPAPIYIRGFLSVYARYVGLDPEALMDQYDKSNMLGKLRETSEGTERKPKAERKTSRRLIPLIVIILAIVCLAIVAWFNRARFF
jgi:cytoskeleton protein RodZ